MKKKPDPPEIQKFNRNFKITAINMFKMENFSRELEILSNNRMKIQKLKNK